MAKARGRSHQSSPTAEIEDDRRGSLQGKGTLEVQPQAGSKAESPQDESFEDGDDEVKVMPQGEETMMSPPAAPASMFWTFEPGRGAKKGDDRIEDPYIGCRLIVAVVYLFRAGNVRYAKVIGQLAVDLMGQEMWHQHLPPYLSSPSDPGDVETVYSLLGEAHRQLRLFDLCSAAYLEGVMATME